MFRVKLRQLVGIVSLSWLIALSPIAAKADVDINSYYSDLNRTFYSQILINDCYAQTRPNEFLKSQTSQPWVWMRGNGVTGVFIGRFMAPADGLAYCSNQSIMGPAMTSFLNYAGYSDIDAFVTALGYTVIQKNNCTGPSQTSCSYSQFYSLEGREPNLSAIQSKTPRQLTSALYYALNSIFAQQCISNSNQGITIERRIIVEEPAGSKKYISKTVSVVIATSQVGGPAQRGSVPKILLAYNYNNKSSNCKDLAKELDDLTDAVLTANSMDPDHAITTSNAVGTGAASNATSSCTIEGVGWFLCPVINFLANIVDASYGLVSNLLVFNGFTSSDGSVAMRSAWEGIRNIANVLFVLGFLVIVFSQITSVGISNYGIKKLLPRLIVAALLVNLSYDLCALAVDLSNLTGASMNGFFEGFKFDSMPESALNTGEGWAGIAGGVLAAGATTAVVMSPFVGLTALLPALISAALSIVTAFLVLTLRQALLILLVVISPLALVAMLLPNTQELAKKWRSIFITMLLLYPIIGLLFGASALASKIITSSASGNIFVQIMGALVSVLPLAITPILLKVSGGVLGKFGAIINNPNRGPFDRMRRGAEDIHKRSQDRKMIAAMQNKKAAMQNKKVFGGAILRRRARTKAIGRSLERSRELAEQNYIAEQIKGDPGFAQKMAGGSVTNPADASALQRAIASAEFTIDQATAENVKAASVSVRNLDKNSLQGIVDNINNSEERRAAAMQQLIITGDPDDYVERADKELQSGSEVMRRYTAEALSKTSLPLKASDISMFASGQHVDQKGNYTGLEATIKANVEANVMSEASMVKAANSDLQYAWDKASEAGRKNLQETAAKLLSNEILKGEIKHNLGTIENITKKDVTTTFKNQ